MEARRTFQGSKSYRQLWIILAALMAAAVLGVGGAFVASGMTSKAPQIVKTYAAPGTVLNQDNYRSTVPHAAPGTVLNQDNYRAAPGVQDLDRESNPGNQPSNVPGKSKQTVF